MLTVNEPCHYDQAISSTRSYEARLAILYDPAPFVSGHDDASRSPIIMLKSA